MKRSSKYFGLKYLVECMPRGQVFFETIAAFNDDDVTAKYAKDCYATAPDGFEYRVMERTGRGCYVEMKQHHCGV